MLELECWGMRIRFLGQFGRRKLWLGAKHYFPTVEGDELKTSGLKHKLSMQEGLLELGLPRTAAELRIR